MLETKIDALTAAVERLIAVLEKQPTQTTPAQATPADAPHAALASTPSDAGCTMSKDALQVWALGKVRDGREPGFKQRLMTELQRHGVRTIAALPDDAAAQQIFDAMGGQL